MKRELLTRPAKNSQEGTNTWHDHEEMVWAIRDWAVRIGVRAPQLRLQAMDTKWGVISSPGWMTLHPDLLTLPKDLGEFVIVHELVHLLVSNHGKLFKCFMDAYLPDWEEKEQRLQTYVMK